MTPTFFLFFLSSVRGVVLDPTARPVEAAEVVCGSERTSTDAHGAFEFRGAAGESKPAAGCAAEVSKPGFKTEHVQIGESTENHITLTLAPASDRVVVTATGAPVALDEAGVAADVFTERDFKARQFPFVQDALRDVAGLNIVQTGSNGGITSVFARGGESNTSMVLLDGIPLNEPGGAIDVSHLTSIGLDRMEIVRGPESALFGAEASSAVIQMFSRHGDPEATLPHGSLSYERGSFSTDHWTGTLDGGLANRIDYAFTADQFRTTGENSNDAFRITTGTANLGYRLSDATSLRAVYRTFDSWTGSPGQTAYGLIDYGAHESDRDSAVSVRLDDARGKHFVQRVIFGYHRYRDLFSDPTGTGPYSIAALVSTAPGPQPRTYFVRLVDPSTAVADPGTTLVTADVPNYGPGSGLTVTDRTSVAYQGTLTHHSGSLVFGYEFERQAGVISASDVTRYDNGVFVNEQYALTSRILLNGGARFEQSSTFGSKFAPRGAVTFRLPTNTYLRLSAARGIKEPELIENFAKEPSYVGNPNLRPEKTNSFEAGLSREWLRRRLRTEASYFRNSFQDLIEFDFSSFPSTWVNINRSWARGAEVSAILRLSGDIALRGAYTKLYTRITQSDLGDLGNPLVRRPRNSGSASLEWTPRRWTLIAGGRFVGERPESDFVFYVINRNTGYEYVFINASWQAARHVAPFLRIGNALDEHYQEVLGYSALSRNATGGLRITW